MRYLLLIVLSSNAAAHCFDEAAARYGVSAELLRAIATVESGHRWNALNRNPNGTYDIGLMQINSGWLPNLARFGVTADQLWHPCTNVHVGAWILAQSVRSHGYTWQAVGAYNAVNPHKRAAYAWRVYQATVRGRS